MKGKIISGEGAPCDQYYDCAIKTILHFLPLLLILTKWKRSIREGVLYVFQFCVMIAIFVWRVFNALKNSKWET